MYEEKLGPVVMAKRALEPEGKWEPLRDDLSRSSKPRASRPQTEAASSSQVSI